MTGSPWSAASVTGGRVAGALGEVGGGALGVVGGVELDGGCDGGALLDELLVLGLVEGVARFVPFVIICFEAIGREGLFCR